MGIIAGVTTNPSLIAKEGRDYAETWPRSPPSWMAPSPAR